MSSSASEHGFVVGDKVQIGVLTGDTVLNGVVDGFYKEFVVINFKDNRRESDGFYLSTRNPKVTGKVSGDWFISKMLVHPNNLRHRDK